MNNQLSIFDVVNNNIIDNNNNNINNRFDAVMLIVDNWANNNEVCDCRDEAIDSLNYMLNNTEYNNYSIEELADETIAAWNEAE